MLNPRLYVSYRKHDTALVAGIMRDFLTAEYGAGAVRMGVDQLPLSSTFRSEIDTAVATCDALLVLIGDDWLGLNPETRLRCCDEPYDFVRIEIESALRRKIPLLPILIGNAMLPAANELPESLRLLSKCQPAAIRVDRDLQDQLKFLVRVLDQHFKALGKGGGSPPESAVLTATEAFASAAGETINPSPRGEDRAGSSEFAIKVPRRRDPSRAAYRIAAVGSVICCGYIIVNWIMDVRNVNPLPILIVPFVSSIYAAVTIRRPFWAALTCLIPMSAMFVLVGFGLAFNLLMFPGFLGFSLVMSAPAAILARYLKYRAIR